MGLGLLLDVFLVRGEGEGEGTLYRESNIRKSSECKECMCSIYIQYCIL